jgi:hypothetical protein
MCRCLRSDGLERIIVSPADEPKVNRPGQRGRLAFGPSAGETT